MNKEPIRKSILLKKKTNKRIEVLLVINLDNTEITYFVSTDNPYDLRGYNTLRQARNYYNSL